MKRNFWTARLKTILIVAVVLAVVVAVILGITSGATFGENVVGTILSPIRTGIAAMLVLLALGVSREDAIADYMLTNVYRKAIIDKFMQDKPADQYDLLLPVEGVSESMGAGSIDILLEKYPSYEAYFKAEYGLTPARLAALRDFYLE